MTDKLRVSISANVTLADGYNYKSLANHELDISATPGQLIRLDLGQSLTDLFRQAVRDAAIELAAEDEATE